MPAKKVDPGPEIDPAESDLADGELPSGDVRVVSTLQLQSGVQYRVLGTPHPDEAWTRVEPSLEDGYIWLMHRAGSPKRVA